VLKELDCSEHEFWRQAEKEKKMALLEDLVEEALGPVALGVGVVILVPTLFPAVGRALRPIAKGVIKAGIRVYDQSSAAATEAYANIAEATGDIIAEARAERASEAVGVPKAKESAASAT
jgi:hypothetical protein